MIPRVTFLLHCRGVPIHSASFRSPFRSSRPRQTFLRPQSASTRPASAACPDDVLKFWFEDLSPTDLFASNAELDDRIRDKFQATLDRAARCELDGWRADADGSLAEIIVLDQFSRNVHRNTPLAFARDGLALALAQEAISKGFDRQLPTAKNTFLYMPFMHSESRVIHARAVSLFGETGQTQLEFETQHKAIVDRFGRYPHRNKILGRESTPEEESFLKEPGSSF